MRVTVTLVGARASGKTWLAERIRRLVEEESAGCSTELLVMSRLSDSSPVEVEINEVVSCRPR